MKKFSKLMLIIACLAMVFCFSAGAWAAMPNDSGYLVGDVNNYKYDGTIDVTVVIESRPYSNTDSSKIFEYFDVTLGQATGVDQISYVNQALYAVSSNNNKNITLCSDGAGSTPMSATSSFVGSVKQGTKVYGSLWMMDGWMFKVNGQIPLSSWTSGPPAGTPSGEAINTTPLKDGDVIHFYNDNPNMMYGADYQPTDYANVNYVYPVATYDAAANKVTVTENTNTFDAAFNWDITAFSPYTNTNTTVRILNSSGLTAGQANIESDGTAEIAPTTSLGSGTCKVIVDSQTTQTAYGLNMNTFAMENFTFLGTTNGFNTFTVN